LDQKPAREDEAKRISDEGGKLFQGKYGPRVIPASGYSIDEIILYKLALNMTRSLGHSILSKFGISSTAEIDYVKIQSGDILVIASDGLWEIITNEEIPSLIANLAPKAAVKHLCKTIEERSKLMETQTDNQTIIIVDFETK